MTIVRCNLLNSSQKDELLLVFKEYTNEYTADGIFRSLCPVCGTRIQRTHTVKKGCKDRAILLFCKEPIEENRSFWIDLKKIIFSRLARLYQLLRSHHLSFTTISEIMDRIFPGEKDTICRAFNSSVESAEFPPVDDMLVVHYDE